MNEELKASMIDWIVYQFTNFFNLEYFRNLIDGAVKEQYSNGLEKAELKLNMNFYPDNEEVSFLQNYVFENLQNGTDQIGKDLKQELSRAMLDGASKEEIIKRVKEVFKDDKYTNRLKTVLRTELVRSNNYGALAGAKQSGISFIKWIHVVNDSRTSDICQAEYAKYGSSEKAIPGDRDFVVRIHGETIRAQAPPFHPNCRSTLMIQRQEND